MISIKIKNFESLRDWYVSNLITDIKRLKFHKTNIAIFEILNGWTIHNFNIKIDTFLKANHSQLCTFTHKYEKNKVKMSPVVASLFSDAYDRFTSKESGIGVFDRKDRITAFDLIDKYGQLVCPYCNKIQIMNKEEIGKRTSQMDHFFHKSKYPFLAVSFFNLIPSCYSCNHHKGVHQLDASPLDSIDITLLSSFHYEGVRSESSLKLNYIPTGGMITNNKHLDIKSSYENNDTNILEKIIRRHESNPLTKLVNELKLPTSPYHSLEDALRDIYMTCFDEDKLHTEHYAKLKFDLLNILYKLKKA